MVSPTTIEDRHPALLVQDDLAELVHHALLADDTLVNRVLALREDDAQRILDYMQKKLEATAPYRAQNHETDMSTYRSRIRTLMTKLALTSGRLPKALFLQDVQRTSTDPVAQGSFSDIYEGQFQGKVVALKRLRVFHMIEDTKTALCRESLLWRNLEHRHVLPFLGIEQGIFSGAFCMVLPWMPGNIHTFMEGLRLTGYSDHALNVQADKWFEQIALGLAYLHSEEIVHGDLRGPNVLIDENWQVKLSDFGLSVLAEGGGSSTSLRGGAAGWLAPELMFPDRYGVATTRPTYASDVYSLACVSVELYTGNTPFFGKSEAQIIFCVANGGRPDRPSFFGGKQMRETLWSLITQCWDGSPLQRPTAEQVVKRLMSEASSSVRRLPVQRSYTTDQCLIPGCPRAAIRHLGKGYYCSTLHQSIGLANTGCFRCRQRDVVHDDLCAFCEDEARVEAPSLLQIPYDHALFESVSSLFRNSWGRSGKACPVVKYVYKIISQQAVMDRYEAYRMSVEQQGQFVNLGKPPGNETNGWHGTRRACQLGNNGNTAFCTSIACSLCGIVKTSFNVAYDSTGLGFGLGWEILGKGIYTSSSSSKSDKYTYNESWSTPMKAMLLNKVVVGNCFIVDVAGGTLAGLPAGYNSARLPQAVTVDDIAVYCNDAIRPSFLVLYDEE